VEIRVVTKVRKLRSNVGVSRALYKKVRFVLNAHRLTKLANPFLPPCFRDYPPPCFTMKLMEVRSYLGYI